MGRIDSRDSAVLVKEMDYEELAMTERGDGSRGGGGSSQE